MRIIAYRTSSEDGKVLLEESTGDSILSDDLVDLFTFLVNETEDEGEFIKICWNMDSTVSLFLKLLGEVKCSKLKDTKRSHLAPFDIFYIPGKVFSVVHIPTKTKCNLYSLDQYFVELDEPDNLIEVKMLGEELLRELKKMGLEPTKLTSPVAIYEECVMKNIDLPRLKDMPLEIAEFAYRTAARLWIESHALGMYDSVFDYDLISAFPNIAKELIDTRSCYWKKSKDYQESAVYGYVRCRVTIYDWVMVHPIVRETEEGCDCPVGTWEAHLSKGELDFIDKWEIGEYQIIEGYWCIPVKNAFLSEPLYVPMGNLLSYKQGSGLQRLMAKRAATGIYGKFGEEREEEFGPYFNPVYFAEISVQAKLQVAEFLYERGIGPGDNDGYKKLIHIGVDGVMLTEEVDLNGTWREEYKGQALVFSSGLVYTNTTKPKGLTLADVLGMIKEHPRRMYYHRKLTRRLTLADSLVKKRLGEIGEPLDFSVSLSFINPRHDRDFKKLPHSGEQIMNNKYISTPRVA